MGYLSCRTPNHNDVDALVALDQRALGGLWSAEAYRREVDSPNSRLLMLVHDPQASQTEGAILSIASMAEASIDQSKSKGSNPVDSVACTTAIRSADRTGAAAPILLGLGCYWAILDEAHITVLAVDPRYQRRGLGQWLLVNLLMDACEYQTPDPTDPLTLTRATLEVRPSNSRALVLYETFGFEPLGRRRHYYSDGEDALILWQNSLKSPDFRDHLSQRYDVAHQRLRQQGWQIKNQKLVVNRT